MNQRIILMLILAAGLFFRPDSATAQNAYWIYFENKTQANFDPLDYFDYKAIDRRIHHEVPILDSSDFPVDPDYIEETKHLSSEYIGSSRWLNAALILATEVQISAIRDLPYVHSIRLANKTKFQFASQSEDKTRNFHKIINTQVGSLGSRTFRELNISGKGIRIAVLDGGFPGVNTHTGFAHIIKQNHIVSTWNFPLKQEDVFKNNKHGTAVLSCIAGVYEGRPTGLATQAEFLLARTELETEPWREQLYWIQAAEWADRNGAQIITSSLGYTAEHFFPEEMDGTSPIAEAARMAFTKGILVINSIGNDGEADWKYVGTPADAKEVLSVGSWDSDSGLKSDFSSFGPSSDGILKPNIIAAGKVVAATSNSWSIGYGTSYSAPLIAGYAACLWEMKPELTNIELFKLIEKTGHLYPYYDYAHGFGVPNPNRITNSDIQQNSTEIQIKEESDSIYIEINRKRRYSPELLFLHFVNKDDRILKYKVIDLEESSNFSVANDEPDAYLFRIRYGRQFSELKLNNE